MPVSPLAQQTRGCLGILTGATLIFLYLPIVFLILFSFEVADTPGFPITGLTTALVRGVFVGHARSTRPCSTRCSSPASSSPSSRRSSARWRPSRSCAAASAFPGTARLLFTLPIMIPGVLIGIGLLSSHARSVSSSACTR